MALHDAEMGRYYEDFVVGDIYRHPLGRTVSEVDNTWFTLLTMNTNQLHFNDHFAQQSEFGRILVNSGLTLAIVLGLSVSDVSHNGIANLGWDEIRLVAPVFVGDTLFAESKVIGLRESESRPHAGIVTVITRGFNEHGTVIMTYRRTVMVRKRTAPSNEDLSPTVDEPWP